MCLSHPVPVRYGAGVLTTHGRILRMLQHREADRVPITGCPWAATLERRHTEGLPRNVDLADYFGLDRYAEFGIDNSPDYPEQTLVETAEYRIHTNSWGATLKDWKHHGSVPEFLRFTIDSPTTWYTAKKRITPTLDCIDRDRLRRDYSRWAHGRPVDYGRAVVWI